VFLFRFFVCGDLLDLEHEILSRSTNVFRLSYTVKARSLYLTWSPNGTGRDRQMDGRTDGQTDGQNYRS